MEQETPFRAARGHAVFISAASMAAALSMVAARAAGAPGALSMALTAAASGGFLLAAAVAGAGRHWFGRGLFAGLFCCFLGDLLGPSAFAAGAAAFLAGHLCFIAAMAPGGAWRRRGPVVVPVAVLSGLVLPWLWPLVPPGDRPLIGGYVLVITVMLACAVAHAGGNRLLLPAAVLFFISDIFVARWKYAGGGAANAWLCYPLYYLACNLFARAAGTETAGSGGGIRRHTGTGE